VARNRLRRQRRSYTGECRRVDWVGDDDLVFVGVGGNHLDGSALRRRYKNALARAGLRRLRFHDLRHTFGTRMIAKATSVACRSG
jgi:integrase